MQQPPQLTDAQRAVVAHDHGPALVFAVAGAGKTTAMVHRIERLVRERIFVPDQMLATSFGKGNEEDIRRSLSRWPHCRLVNVHTLHAVGRQIIVLARRHAYLRRWRLDGNADGVHSLLNATIAEAWRRNVPYRLELDGLDRRDFLSYVDACKGNLRYANLAAADLPPQALAVARQAPAPGGALTWYLDLYRLFEEVRYQRQAITFSDMLLTGWEALTRYPEVLEAVQGRFRCVLVDEYQDINLAQSEMLDLITQPDRHYMAIGDDDQTIYEWRGASPRFILNFAERYQARRYLIADNFRCPAGPLVLANNVIAHNQERAPKRLQLSRGFRGETTVLRHKDQAQMADHIVRRIRSVQSSGGTLNDIAVLVRLNAQTPYIEQALIAAGLPYRVSLPFYNRSEIQTLIHYVRLAWVEREMQEGKQLTTNQKQWFVDAWYNVYNRPKRYLSRELRDLVLSGVIRKGVPPTRALQFMAAPRAPHDGIMESIEQLADDIAWLAARLGGPAYDALWRLDLRLEYREFLRESSGFPQTGEGRAASVAAFTDYARDRGNLLAFMGHIRELAAQKIGRKEEGDAVTLSTIHGAKGLEWSVVFIAGCNQEMMPFQGSAAENMEEERRLFYVALTRTKRDLSLHYVKTEPPSQFLREAKVRQALPVVEAAAAALARDPAAWEADDALAVARAVSDLHLERYFGRWWDASPEHKQAVAQTMQRFFSAVAAESRSRDISVWELLGLRAQDRDIWQELALSTEPDVDDFPRLETLLTQLSERDAGARSGAEEAITNREPQTVTPGMWVHSDAGWGRIERIIGRDGVVLERSAKGPIRYLYVTLRPSEDATPAEIDPVAGRIRFPQNNVLYTCTKCHAFSAPDSKVISKGHNRAAHGGVGARFRQEQKPERPLRQIFYRAGAPPDPLV